jgi:copper chaperone CopZ
MQTETMTVTGMKCGGCPTKISLALNEADPRPDCCG